jgi:hypothetical protein
MLRLLSGCGAPLLAVRTWTGSFGTILFSASLVDDERPSARTFTLQPINGGSAFCNAAHRHEREASRPAGHSIIDDVDLGDGSERLEQGAKIRFGSLRCEVSNIEFLDEISFARDCQLQSRSRVPSFKSPLRTPTTIYRASN